MPNRDELVNALRMAAARIVDSFDGCGDMTKAISDLDTAVDNYDKLCAAEALSATTDGENDEIAFSASEGACYAYPGENQTALRQAFCDGAVYTRTGKLAEKTK